MKKKKTNKTELRLKDSYIAKHCQIEEKLKKIVDEICEKFNKYEKEIDNNKR